MANDNIQAPIEMGLVQVIESTLIQGNVTEMVLTELKNKFGNVKLNSTDDKEGYLEAKEAKEAATKVRTTTVGICKKGREEALATQRLWLAKEKEIIGRIAADVEDNADKCIDEYETAQKLKKEQEKQRKENEYILRQQALTKLGAIYADNCFVLGEVSFEGNLIKQASDEVFTEIILKYKEVYDEIEKVRIAKEQEEAAEKQRLLEAQQELERKQKEFEQQQLEFKQQQEELERQQKEKQLEEERKIEQQKTELNKQRLEFLRPYLSVSTELDLNTLHTIDSEFFGKLLTEKADLLEAEKQKQQKLEEERLEQAKQQAIADEKERQRVAEEQKQEQIRLESIKKQEEIEKASDKEKWGEFLKQLNTVGFFEMRSGQYRTKMLQAKAKIEEINAL